MENFDMKDEKLEKELNPLVGLDIIKKYFTILIRVEFALQCNIDHLTVEILKEKLNHEDDNDLKAMLLHAVNLKKTFYKILTEDFLKLFTGIKEIDKNIDKLEGLLKSCISEEEIADINNNIKQAWEEHECQRGQS